MIRVDMSKEIYLTPHELLEEFKSLPAGEQILFLEMLIDHVYENSADYHRSGMGDWYDSKHDKWIECEAKLKEMLEKDYSETDKQECFFELFDVSLSAKTIEK